MFGLKFGGGGEGGLNLDSQYESVIKQWLQLPCPHLYNQSRLPSWNLIYKNKKEGKKKERRRNKNDETQVVEHLHVSR